MLYSEAGFIQTVMGDGWCPSVSKSSNLRFLRSKASITLRECACPTRAVDSEEDKIPPNTWFTSMKKTLLVAELQRQSFAANTNHHMVGPDTAPKTNAEICSRAAALH